MAASGQVELSPARSNAFAPEDERRWRVAAAAAALAALALVLRDDSILLALATVAGAAAVACGLRSWTKWRQAAGAAMALLAVAGAHLTAFGPAAPLSALAPAAALLAVAGFAMALPDRFRYWGAGLALAVAGATMAALIRQGLARAPWANHPVPTAWVPWPLAATALLLSFGWLAAEPARRPVALLRESSSAGWLTRRALPLVFVYPFLASWLHSRSGRNTDIAQWEGALLFVVATYLVFLTLMTKGARALDEVDVSREQLRAYAREVSDLYDHAPCGYHSLDADARVVRINDTELAWLGYQRSELMGRRYTDLLCPEVRELFITRFAALKASGGAPEFEVELRRKDGTWLPALISATAILDHDGKFLRTRTTVFDATQRRQAEAALRHSEARHRAILSSAADAIVTLSAHGQIVEFNPAAEWMFGMRRSVALEMMGADLLATGSPLALVPLAVMAGEVESFPPNHIEFEARRADGSIFPAEFTITRVAGQDPALFTAFIRNLSERKRVERELRRSEEQLRLLLNSTGEGIFTLDLDGHCTLCNPAAVRLLGYASAEELLGRSMHKLIHHTRPDGSHYPARECKGSAAVTERCGVVVDDEVFWRQDGTSLPVEYHSYPIEHESETVGLVVTFVDITMRRNLEGQIRQSQKMEAIGRLAAGVAHDFNNLLTVINGYADMLLESTPDGDMRDKLGAVRTAGERAALLTHQLLAFSRQQVLQPQILDLNAEVRELQPLLQRSAGEDHELVFELDPGLRTVRADPGQIDQVLMNLVVNANDATPPGGTITIATANVTLNDDFVRSHPGLKPGVYARLTVRDTGTGIRPEVQAHIFEPFFTTKPQGKGTGLGLPTVFGVARQSGGAILVESEWGRGTAMHVYLPEQTARAGARAEIQCSWVERQVPPRPDAGAGPTDGPLNNPLPAGHGELILVVEDEDGLRQLMVEVLHARGYTVMESRGAEEALSLCDERLGELALLITDVVMPGLHGPALAARLRQEQAQLPVLFVSGYAGTEDEMLRYAVGEGVQYLRKPFGPEMLAHAVSTMLTPAAKSKIARESSNVNQSRTCAGRG